MIGIRTGALLALAMVTLAIATLAFAGTHLTLRSDGPDDITLESSTGSGVKLPVASADGAGLMSSRHARAVDGFTDDVVTGGQLVEGVSLTLYTSLGDAIVIPVVTPTPIPHPDIRFFRVHKRVGNPPARPPLRPCSQT